MIKTWKAFSCLKSPHIRGKCVKSKTKKRPYKDTGFQWSPTHRHMAKLLQYSGGILPNFLLSLFYCYIQNYCWPYYVHVCVMQLKKTHKCIKHWVRGKIKLLIIWLPQIFGPVFFLSLLQRKKVKFSSDSYEAASLCFSSSKGEFDFHSLFS